MARSNITDLLNLPYQEYVECRALLHAWEEIPLDGDAPRKWVGTKSTAILEFRCERCSTRRYDVWSRVTGDLIERAYRIPPDYSLPKGAGAKVLVRKAYLEMVSRPSSNGKRA